jgi:diguanylate cyclase (GGDEF)-like protein
VSAGQPRGTRHPGFRAYVTVCGLAGLAAVVVAATSLDVAGLRAVGGPFWLLAGLLLLGELRPVVASGAYDPEGVTVSTAFVFAILFSWGPWPALLVQAVAIAAGEVARRKRPWQVVFNTGQYVLSLSAAAAVLHLLGSRPSPSDPLQVSLESLPAMAVAWAAYFLVNLALVAGALAIRDRHGYWEEFSTDFGYYALTTFAVLALSPVVVVVTATVWQLIPLLLLPLFLVYKTASISLEKEHASQHDALTGLGNRKLLTEQLSRCLEEARRQDRLLALCVLDLDRFKEVNDTLGHQTGDRLLEVAGARLAGAVRPGDSVARLGGDEFAVLFTEVDGPVAAREAAERIRGVLGEPYHLDGMMLGLDASAGVAVFPTHGRDAEELFRFADVAMYQAKAERTGVEVYDRERDRHTLTRLGLGAELRGAVERQELEAHFQPKVALPGREVIGVEALLRWRHPEHGLLAPGEFLDLAGQDGVMRSITSSALVQSLSRVATWWRDGLRVPVSVNVSLRDLADEGFVDVLARLLAGHRLPADVLQLEITEHVLMADPSRVSPALERLGSMGVSLSLDDFGTGYSSLVHLRRLPVAEIKVDRSFVARMTDEPDDAAVVRSIIDLGHALGVRVVAEGVEDEATLDALVRLGCDAVQGWLVSRPLPADRATDWVRERCRPDQAVGGLTLPGPPGTGTEREASRT